MKKILIFVFLLLAPITVKAYDINDYRVNATIQTNGDLEVQEYIDVNGDYNGFFRDILFQNPNSTPFEPEGEYYGGSQIHNGNGIILNEIKAVEKQSEFNFENTEGDLFKKVNKSSLGNYAEYETTNLGNGYKYKMYLPSYYNKAFYLNYTIKNMAVKHNDVGELMWNIVGNSLDQSVEFFTAYINIPNNVNIKAWAHGPLNGNVEIINSNTIKVSVLSLESNVPIDVRTTFDLKAIDNSTKTTNVAALNKILAYEQKVADEANEKRIKAQKEIIDNAKRALMALENDLNRSNYRYAEEYVSLTSGSEDYEELNKKLEDLLLKLIDKEKINAETKITKVEKSLKYSDYETAKNSLIILEEGTYKDSLTERLEKTIPKIKNKEKLLEQKNCIIILILIMIFIINIYHKRKKDKLFGEKYYGNKYCREIPETILPTELGFLLNKKITKQSVSATILNLINKKIITYQKNQDEEIELLKNTKSVINLSSSEKCLMSYIFQDGKKINIKDFKRRAQTKYSSYYRKYNVFEEEATKEAKGKKYFENKRSKPMIYFLYIIMLIIALSIGLPYLIMLIMLFIIYKISKLKRSYLILTAIINTVIIVVNIYIVDYINKINYYYNTSILLNIVLILCLIVMTLIYTFKINYTENGLKSYYKWKAFERFLKDFSLIDKKELPEIALWNEYLVYATVLGCSKKLAKDMNVALEEQDNTFLLCTCFGTIDYINRTIYDTKITATNTYNSRITNNSTFSSSSSSSSSFSDFGSSSSGSGSGGGFSSGGGSGGGGGGGSRF